MLDQQTIITVLVSGGTALTVKAASDGVVKSLVDLWNGAIGHYIHSWSEKRRLIMEEKFIPSVAEKISKIPDENLQEPKISILGPTLEASKFYIEEEEIREMFSNLIAASMDSTYNGIVQHSFVEIIKQLSSYDAKFLSAIQNYIQSYDLKKNQTIFQRTFCIMPDFLDFEKNSIAITNLHRLGILDLIQYFQLNEFSQKDFIINSQIISDLKKESDFSMQPHTYVLSPLGINFKKVCIKDTL